ncbi:hypothetical protein Tco_0230884 [Tanacetum coccineum]
MRTRIGLDTLSFDDLYNNLRDFESDVKGSGGSSSSAHNVAFVGSECTTSTNEVSTAYGSSTSSGQRTHKEISSSYVDKLVTVSLRISNLPLLFGEMLNMDDKPILDGLIGLYWLVIYKPELVD